MVDELRVVERSLAERHASIERARRLEQAALWTLSIIVMVIVISAAGTAVS